MDSAALSPTTRDLSATRHHRRQLHTALVELEQAIAAPARRPAAWGDAVAAAVGRFEAALADHTHHTEAEDGLFAQVTEDAPEVAHQIAALTREHAELQESATALLARCRGTVDVPDVDGIREDALDLLRAGSRHRQRGADLLYDAYEMDVGGDA